MFLNANHLIDGAKGALVGAAIDRLYPYRPNRTRDTLLTTGAFIGMGLVGVVIGLLIAPKSGKEMRADLKTKATDLKDRALEAGEEFSNVAARVAGSNGSIGATRPSRP